MPTISFYRPQVERSSLLKIFITNINKCAVFHFAFTEEILNGKVPLLSSLGNIFMESIFWRVPVDIYVLDYINKQTTVQKMKFSIKDFFSKCDQICSFLRIWSYLLKKSLMENFIFCAMHQMDKQPKGKHCWKM